MLALDGATGKELWTSGDQVTSFNYFSGLAVANGKFYIGTYEFGRDFTGEGSWRTNRSLYFARNGHGQPARFYLRGSESYGFALGVAKRELNILLGCELTLRPARRIGIAKKMFSSSSVLSFIGRGTPLTKRASAHLDMIRGLAALAVMFGHIRGLFYLDYQDVTQHRGAALSLLYAITGMGHQAVMVFFVLSGFLIGGSVLTSLKRWDWKRYLVNRFCRLYLVLLPALVLTAVLDHFAHQQPGAHKYFDFPIAHFNTHPLAGRDTPRIFLGNALFLQTIAVPSFGSDSPLWSLANEFWYYLLFPSILMALFSAGNALQRVAGILISGVLVAWLPAGILLGFLVWLMGAAIHLIQPLRAGRRLLLTLHALLLSNFALVLMLDRMQRIPANLGDPAIGMAFALWLLLLVKGKAAPVGIPHAYAGCAGLLSKCSYSVYVVHFPIAILIRASAGTWLWAPTGRTFALGLLLSTGVFFCGWVFSRFTEANTDTVRAAVIRVVSRPPRVRQTAA